jgi:uncharacterized protein (DUF433 family)
MQLPDFLAQSPDGEILIVGHRIALYHLLQRYNEGESAEMLAAHYPTLPLSLVHKLLAFYLDNQSEVDAYLRDSIAAMNEQQHSARKLDVDALRRRLANAGLPSRPEAQVG